VLTEALRMVRLTGAVYLRGEFTAPWGFDTPAARDLVMALCPEAEQLVIFHAVIEGTCEVRLESGESVRGEEGEFIILPYGHQHTMLSPGSADRVPIADLLPAPPWANMQVTQAGQAGGSRTRVLCSYLDCGDILFNPLLRALPRLLKVRPQPGPGADWLRAGLRYSAELSPDAIARDAIGSRLPELLLVETLRQYLAQLPSSRTGWLGALADPVIGDALLRIHGDPARAWTVGLLAEELTVSRSVLAAKFSERLGQSPMRYVALWRLQLASHLLQTTDLAVSAVATRVGYESEPAFSRAFKRELGVAPGAWRSRAGKRQEPVRTIPA
jgi:AraC-like DNA-binding protein